MQRGVCVVGWGVSLGFIKLFVRAFSPFSELHVRGEDMTFVEHVPVADETVATKEAGVPGGFTEISKPVRRNTALITARAQPLRRQTTMRVPCSGPLSHNTHGPFPHSPSCNL